MVLMGSLWLARRRASRATSSDTPAISNMIRPGFTTETQYLSEDLNVLRNGAAIEKAIVKLNELLLEVRGLTTAIPFFGIVKLLRLENDLIAALALAHSAYLRNESCGCHVRTDCPDADPESAKYRTVVSYGEDGTMKADRKNI